MKLSNDYDDMIVTEFGLIPARKATKIGAKEDASVPESAKTNTDNVNLNFFSIAYMKFASFFQTQRKV